jgi:hypothetical protein
VNFISLFKIKDEPVCRFMLILPLDFDAASRDIMTIALSLKSTQFHPESVKYRTSLFAAPVC